MGSRLRGSDVLTQIAASELKSPPANSDRRQRPRQIRPLILHVLDPDG